MSFEKENFLRTQLVRRLQQIDPNTNPAWGRMSFQHMVEHLILDGVQIASGRVKHEIFTPAERLPLYREFLMSDKPMRPNTVNPVLPPDPVPLRFNTPQAAIAEFQSELIYFFEVHAGNPQLITTHPIFGDLNFEENVQLLYKHSAHHLKQFGSEIW